MDPSRVIVTAPHPNETLEQVMEFARCLAGEDAGEVDVVELGQDPG